MEWPGTLLCKRSVRTMGQGNRITNSSFIVGAVYPGQCLVA